jgi:hypothetical protein
VDPISNGHSSQRGSGTQLGETSPPVNAGTPHYRRLDGPRNYRSAAPLAEAPRGYFVEAIKA